MTNTVILTVGASSSGKTSWAEQYTAIHPNTKIVCRDDIRRTMQFPPLGNPQQENMVTRVHRGLIHGSLQAGMDVIVADTNLNKKYREDLIRYCTDLMASVTLVVFRQELDVLLDRTRKRPEAERVPEDVVTRHYNALQAQLDDGSLDTLYFLPY